jgi:hypothetical protein
MLRAQSILVTLFTLLGIAMMVICLYQYIQFVNEAGAAGGLVGALLVVLSAMGALITTVGLSASMIVSAIRNQPVRPL